MTKLDSIEQIINQASIRAVVDMYIHGKGTLDIEDLKKRIKEELD